MTRKVVTVDAVTKALPSYVIEQSDLLTNAAAPALIEDVVTPMLQGIGPLASWTQTGNRTVAPSSVDFTTDSFAAVGHGLIDGDKIIPFANGGVIAALRQYLPAGMVLSPYYVVGATADSFQISATLGGVAVDLTARGTQDLTKWHFESVGAPFDGFAGLNHGRLRLVLNGQFLYWGSQTFWMRPNANRSTTFATSGTLAANGTGGGGPAWGIARCDVVFDGRSSATVVGTSGSIGQLAATADATLATKTLADNLLVALPPQSITSLSVFPSVASDIAWANGSTMVVYTQ